MGPGPVIGAARLNWVFHDLLMLQVCTQYVSLCHFPCIQPHWIPPKWVATGLSFLQGFYEGINVRARSHHVEKRTQAGIAFVWIRLHFWKYHPPLWASPICQWSTQSFPLSLVLAGNISADIGHCTQVAIPRDFSKMCWKMTTFGRPPISLEDIKHAWRRLTTNCMICLPIDRCCNNCWEGVNLDMIDVLSRWCILYYTWTTLILPKGNCLCRWVDGRWEERSDFFYYVGTHVRYIYYIVCDIMWYCTVVTMMWSMRHLWWMLTDTVHVIDAAPKWHNTICDGPIAGWSSQSTYGPTMLGSLMSDSRWPIGPVIGLQFNTPPC